MPEAVEELGETGEHAVTPLELFFDLVFVFAITQVTTLLTNDPTWHGAFRGALVLAAIWWAWSGYAWFTSTLDVDEGAVRLVMLASTATMLGVALAVPGAFGDDALLFALSYLLVRVFHVVLYANAGRDDPDLLGALLRLAPTELVGACLLVVAAFLTGDARIALWLVALVIDYGRPAVVALEGWRIAPAHFAERHRLVVLIALGESIIAIPNDATHLPAAHTRHGRPARPHPCRADGARPCGPCARQRGLRARRRVRGVPPPRPPRSDSPPGAQCVTD